MLTFGQFVHNRHNKTIQKNIGSSNLIQSNIEDYYSLTPESTVNNYLRFVLNIPKISLIYCLNVWKFHKIKYFFHSLIRAIPMDNKNLYISLKDVEVQRLTF